MTKLLSFTATVLAINVCVCSAQGNPAEQSQLKEALQASVVQQKLLDCTFGPTTPISFGFGTMVADDGGAVTLKGVDHLGKPWSATYQANPGAGCQLWSTYLGTNGERDLAFVQPGLNSSGGWDTTLSILMFDDKGRPFPWQATSRFTIGEKGIAQIVLLGAEKKPAIIVPVQLVPGENSSGVEYDVYTANGPRFSEIRGDYGGMKWPLMEPRGLQVSQTSTLGQTLSTTSESTDEEDVPTNAPRFTKIVGETDSDRRLVLTNSTVSIPDVLVLDSKAGRKIISSPLKADLSALQVGSAKGVPLGNDCASGECHPVVVWFKQ